jgi:hypothetical protein
VIALAQGSCLASSPQWGSGWGRGQFCRPCQLGGSKDFPMSPLARIVLRSPVAPGHAAFGPSFAGAPPVPGSPRPNFSSLWLPPETFRNVAEIWRNTPLKSGTQAEHLRNTCGTNRHICGTNRKITGTNRNISGTLRQISGTRTATFCLIGTERRFTRVQVALKRGAKIVSS